MEKFLPISPYKYIISAELQNKLSSDSFDPIIKDKHPDGIYIVRMFSFGADKTLIFNYIHYNALFTDFMFLYLFTRHVRKNLLSEPLVKTFITVESSLKPSFLNGFHSYMLNDNDIMVGLFNINDSTTIYELYAFIFRLTLYTEYKSIASIIMSAYTLQFYDLISKVYKDSDSFIHNSDNLRKMYDSIPSPYSQIKLVDYSLIVCSDLNKLLHEFKLLGFTVNQGPQSTRGEVNALNNYLSLFDLDFRNCLYYHHRYHASISRPGSIPTLTRNRFSYKNIHMNLGHGRWFSSQACIAKVKCSSIQIKKLSTSTSVLSNRQVLFQDNYKLIKNILVHNNNLSLFNVQSNIEHTLHNQELKFSDLNTVLNKLNYKDSNMDLLISKKKLLGVLMSKSQFTKTSKDDRQIEYKNWLKKILEELSVDTVSNLLLSFFMQILVKETKDVNDVETPGIPVITAFEMFGAKIVNKYIYSKYINSVNYKVNSVSLSLFKHLHELEFNSFKEDTFNSKIGGYFVCALIEVGLFYQELDVKSGTTKEKEYYLRIDTKIRSLLLKFNSSFLHIPQRLPMVCEPKDFIYSTVAENNKLGGYLLNDVYYTDHIFKNKKGHDKVTELDENNIVVSLINGLSKIPYRVNTDTLEFVKLFGFEKNMLTDDSDDKLQLFMANPYSGSNKKERNKYRSILSRITLERNILNISDCYSAIDKIYFPVRIDLRTRVYCETDYFDYQKTDLAKGLISFANPGVITKLDELAIKYLKGFGANMYGCGLDKKSMNYKVKWVDDNADYILNFRTNDIVNKAENKTCFVSFCFEYERLVEFMNDNDKTMFYSYLPIQLDASCNGYQHLALLTKETKIFNKLNLDKSTHDDVPDDFYKYVLEQTKDYIVNKIDGLSNLSKISDKQNKELGSLRILKDVNFDRTVIKKVVMTESYNAGDFKLIDHITSNLLEHSEDCLSPKTNKVFKHKYYTYKDSTIKIDRADLLVYVMSLKTVIETISPKKKELSDYLDNVVKICTKLNMPVPWTLPNGAIINESYQKHEELTLKAFTFLKARYTFIKFIKGTIDLRKQKRSTMPNLIHSLDATTIALLYEDFKHSGSLYTVHDCFATTANHVPFLINVLKSVYIKLYSSNDYLTQFDSLVKININKQFGDKVYKLYDSYVYIPTVKDKIEAIRYPDINKVLNVNNTQSDKVNNLILSSYTLI